MAQEQYTAEEFEAALQAQLQERLQAELAKQQPQSPKIDKNDERYAKMQEELALLKDAQKEADKVLKAAEKEKAAKEAALAAERKKAEEAELSAQQLIEKRSAEMQAQYEQLARQREEDRAIFERERELDRLAVYTERAIAANRDNIEPRLLKYIGGRTEEEVDHAVARAVADTQEMFADIAEAQTQGRAAMPGVRTGPPAITELDAPASDGSVSAQDIKAMSWDQYAQFRQGRVPQSGQGIFG